MGWGLPNQFPPFCYSLIFHHDQNWLSIEYHIHNWQVSPQFIVVVTPLKYKSDEKNLTDIFEKWKLYLTEKLTNKDLVTSTPGPAVAMLSSGMLCLACALP